ncbi:chromatin assembly factor 1 subunit FAS1 [Nymphaea colorata]|nr:chromatin assembly factor 1 subunit FAS1 [Nymphaea colorata]XP_031477924.1 chromatin assembly factor 1 subunit FAS1 [Nymphaea colorata]
MAENMASCHGSRELAKGKSSKRGYPSLVEGPSPGQKSKVQRVGDYNGNFDNSGEQILPRFSPNSVLLVSLAGQVVGTEENKAERSPKEESASHKLTTDANVRDTLKRKRDSMIERFSVDKKSSISSLRAELDGLFKYFDEVSDQKTILGREDSVEVKLNRFSNSTVACLLEESRLPFSKLVEQIFDKLNKSGSGDSAGLTLSAVRSSVLFAGQRSMYGIPKPDADVLEDESGTCLWCWEARDMKLLPKSERGTINVRRICRKKIHDRIMAVSAMISSLSASENQANYKSDLMKAAEKIVRISDEAQIRAFANSLIQRHSVLEEEKEAKLKEKAFIKEMEQNKRTVDKEQKRLEKELRKEQLRNEKELKRQLDVTAKEEKQREKEEAEMRKQLKKHQEEVEKDQRRRVKQETELKKQLAIKKQASIMERFLKRNANSTSDDQSSKGVPEPVPTVHNEGVLNEVVSSMDQTLSQQVNLSSSELLKLHLVVWKGRSCSASCNKSKRWGFRHRPKVELIKELRLQRTSCVAGPSGKVVDPTRHGCSNVDDAEEVNIEKLVHGWGEAVLSDGPTLNTVTTGSTDMQVVGRKKKLLQFDKSHRPAYYGTMSRTSDVVGPRHPLQKDPNLDYDNDSDEEWEEEDPGENLSDFDKDDEEENIESDENPKAEDEDESEDGFVVPDGYLSDNEGVYVDELELDNSEDESKISTTRKIEAERGDINALLKQQKYLSGLTDHALGKNQPLIILNLMHEKDVLMTAEVNGTQRLEQICLQALSMRPMTEGISIDITTNWERCEDTCTPNMLGNNNNYAAVANSLQESDLPEIVSSIQSHSHGINKVIESLQKKFPSVPKVHLRSKVKEISEFSDNRWQVKKDILDKLGLSASPEKHFMRSKGIATFFKKRCLPPEGEFANTMGSPLQPCEKTNTVLGNPRTVSDAL